MPRRMVINNKCNIAHLQHAAHISAVCLSRADFVHLLRSILGYLLQNRPIIRLYPTKHRLCYLRWCTMVAVMQACLQLHFLHTLTLMRLLALRVLTISLKGVLAGLLSATAVILACKAPAERLTRDICCPWRCPRVWSAGMSVTCLSLRPRPAL